MKKWLVALLGLGLVLAGCETASTAPDDTGPADGALDGAACATSCDDGLFCNGVETCTAGHCAAGTSPCIASQSCDEASDTCASACGSTPDADHDGVASIACGGADCDDTNPGVHPGIVETCDTTNVDEACAPTTYGAHDADGDGHDSNVCCNGTHCGDDCDDLRIDVFLGASETCNGRDDDCDGSVDEELGTSDYYADCDGDTYGSTVTTTACSAPTSPRAVSAASGSRPPATATTRARP